MTEPDVTLTDYLLTVECLACAWSLATAPAAPPDRRRWATAFFVATGLAAASGGTMHGFFSEPDSLAGLLLWRLSLLAIGAAAAAGTLVAASLSEAADAVRAARRGIAVAFIAYALVVVLGHDPFWMAIAGYVPAALILLVAVQRHRSRGGPPRAGLTTWGLLITFAAAGGQQAGVGLPALSLGHNALYHLIQAVGLLFVFAGFRALLQPPAPDPIDRVNGDERHSP